MGLEYPPRLRKPSGSSLNPLECAFQLYRSDKARVHTVIRLSLSPLGISLRGITFLSPRLVTYLTMSTGQAEAWVWMRCRVEGMREVVREEVRGLKDYLKGM